MAAWLGEVRPAQKLGRQRGRARLGQGAAIEADLAAGVAGRGPQVLPVLVQQPLAGQEPEPEEERHRRVLAVLRQPAGRIEARLLDDIRRVDAPLQPAVEAQGDHAPQPVAVPAQQLPERPLVAPHGLLDQPRRLASVG